MKRKLFSIGCCLVMLLATILISCQQEVPAPKTAVIGDVLLNDGTYVPYASITDAQKAKAVAVVCGFNGKGKTLGLGLKQSDSKLAWAPGNCTGFSTNFGKIVCTPSVKGSEAADKLELKFTGDTDGSDNWNKICEQDTNAVTTAATNYPAFNWVNNYGTTYSLPEGYKDGWYMPSIAELTEIYKNKDKVNAALKVAGDAELKNDWYWSSSQYGSYYGAGWKLGFNNGYLENGGKSGDCNVCCVRAF